MLIIVVVVDVRWCHLLMQRCDYALRCYLVVGALRLPLVRCYIPFVERCRTPHCGACLPLLTHYAVVVLALPPAPRVAAIGVDCGACEHLCARLPRVYVVDCGLVPLPVRPHGAGCVPLLRVLLRCVALLFTLLLLPRCCAIDCGVVVRCVALRVVRCYALHCRDVAVHWNYALLAVVPDYVTVGTLRCRWVLPVPACRGAVGTCRALRGGAVDCCRLPAHPYVELRYRYLHALAVVPPLLVPAVAGGGTGACTLH